MWFANLLTKPRSHGQSLGRRAVRTRLTLKSLEDRSVPSYTVLDLGAFTGYDLNNVGQVVGNAGVFNLQSGTMTGPPGRGINDAGQLAGGTTGAFLYDPSAGFTNLGYLPGDSQSYANDLNMAGQVVGVSDLGATGVYAGAASNGADNSHAFLWDATNGMQFLGPFPSRNYSTATCINEVGQVVGWAQTSFNRGTLQSTQLGFFRDSTGETTLLSGLLGRGCSEARGINDLGTAAGS